jgi:hypothetical protein
MKQAIGLGEESCGVRSVFSVIVTEKIVQIERTKKGTLQPEAFP